MFFHEFFILLTIVPILLIPIEAVLPYPYIVEEIIKFIVILSFFKIIKKNLSAPILGGFLFAFTETILYILNIISRGQPYLIFQRLLFTGIMHISTMVLIYLGIKKSLKIGFLALVLSIAIHYLFNTYCYILN